MALGWVRGVKEREEWRTATRFLAWACSVQYVLSRKVRSDAIAPGCSLGPRSLQTLKTHPVRSVS